MEIVSSSLVTATGDRTPFQGKCTVSFQIGNRQVKHDVLFADIQNEGIIGFDFLSKHRCNVSLSNFDLTINGKMSIPLQT